MNILLMTTHLNAGGITSYLVSLARGLRAQGHAVTLASSGGNRQEDFDRLGVRQIILPIKTKSEADVRIYGPLFYLAGLVKENHIDVIHAQTRVTQVMGCLLSRLTKKPYVTTCHGFFTPRWFRRLVPCWGDHTIAISPAVKEHLEGDFHLSPNQISVIRNGIDVADFPVIIPSLKSQKRKARHIPGGPTVGIIARLSAEKNHLTLIDAMRYVVAAAPRVRLLIIGEGRMEEALRRRVRTHALTSHVLFFKTVNRTAEFLSLLDVFVMPSTKEGLGLSVMEAQAAGLPVVVSRAGGLPSLVRDGETGLLVEAGDDQALADAMLFLLRHPDQAQDMGRRARSFIAEECSHMKMAQETIRAYQKVLEKPS